MDELVPTEAPADIAADDATDAVLPERPSLPDRADAPVSEVAERFLKVVLETVPLTRLAEVHLFSPLRQGLVETGIAVVAADVPGSSRHTVYTARYRLVLKGPERGKWEADVVAEADAPLVTVETVVRGVQRRAGEESEIICYSAEQVARAARVPWPPADTPIAASNATDQSVVVDAPVTDAPVDEAPSSDVPTEADGAA